MSKITNEQKYTTVEERVRAFMAHRSDKASIVAVVANEFAHWLALEADEEIRLVAENARLAARLEAVAKECNMLLTDCGCNVREFHVDYVRKYADAILRAARGEGGAE